MLWGFFGAVHIVSLLISAGMIVGLYFLLRNRTDRTKVLVLGFLSFAGIAAILFNLLTWDSPLEYLPFHLCSLAAMVMPFAVFTRSKVLNNLLILWSLGAYLALVVNNAQADYEILSWTFAFYYFPHTLEAGIPILMFALKLAKKDVKCIFSTVGITFGAYTVIHFINLWINDYCIANQLTDWAGDVIQVNYMYSIYPENPVLQLFYNLLPVPFWYMLPALLVITVFLGFVYLGDIVRAVKKWKKQ